MLLPSHVTTDETMRSYLPPGVRGNAGSGTIPSAAVCLWHQEGRIVRQAFIGDGPVDAVFKAISDPTRRILVEELAERDEQTLFELCVRLISRHGVSA